MVGADFERGGERSERGAEPQVAAQRHVDARHHRRGVDQRPHLGDVSGADDQQEVGRKPVGERGDDPDPGVDAADAEHQPHGRHGEEEESGRRVEDAHDLADGPFDQLGRVGDVDQIGGHAAEHAARPLGVFARLGARPADVVRHSLVLEHVVLGQRLAAELGGEIERAHREKQQQGRRDGRQPGEKSVRKIHLFAHYRLPKVRKNIDSARCDPEK